MKYTPILATLAAGMMLASGCTKAETPPAGATKPVAVVNGTPISQDVWQLYVKASHGGKTPGELTADEQKEALDSLIGLYVGAQEAEKKNLAVGEPGARLELIRNSSLTELLFKEFTGDAKPTDEELKAEYDERIAEAPKNEYHARHILVDDEAAAKGLITQLDQGANFEKLAEENSKDGGSAVQGGDLGWFSPSQMVKPFADAVQQLEPGKYTATPVQSEFGWHVIKLEESRASSLPSFEQVKDQLVPMVERRKFDDHLKELAKTAKVERSL